MNRSGESRKHAIKIIIQMRDHAYMADLLTEVVIL